MVGCLLFCVDVTDRAQQCSVLHVISGYIDGILHRHSLLLRGVRVLVLFVLFVFTKSAVLDCTFITSYTLLPRQKKYSFYTFLRVVLL